MRETEIFHTQNQDIILSFEQKVKANHVIDLCHMRYSDIPDVADLYRAVSIHAGNYQECLAESDPRSFASTGGLFVIQTEQSLKKLLRNQKETIIAAKDQFGHILGLVWHTAEICPASSFSSINWNTCVLKAHINAQYRQGKLVYNGEIMIRQGNPVPKLSVYLLYTMLYTLQQQGFSGMCGEVYRVCAYDDGSGPVSCDLFNERSYHMLLKSGAIPVGESARRSIVMSGLTVQVVPTVIYWDISNTLDRLDQIFCDGNIDVDKANKNKYGREPI